MGKGMKGGRHKKEREKRTKQERGSDHEGY